MNKRIRTLLLLCMGMSLWLAMPTRAASEPVATAAPTAAPTATPLPGEETPVRTITKIEVTDTEKEIPYGSQFDSSNVILLVHYSDDTIETVHPDQISTVDTSRIGTHDITVKYQDMSIVYTITVIPRQVTGVRMTKGTANSMTIAWNKLEEAENYEIYTSDRKDGKYTLKKSTTKTEFTFEKMEPGKIIYVKVRAAAGDTAGEYSDITPIAPKPGKVTGVKAIKNVKTKITLQWDKTTGATGYAIYYRLSTATAYTFGGSTTELSYQVTGLKAGQDYSFIVYAYGADISNLGDGSNAAVFGTAPSIPEITKVKGGDKRVKVYWKKGSGAQLFRIYVSTKSTSGFKLKTTVPADEYKIRGLDGLSQKKKYYVKVEAVRTVSGMELSSVSAVKYATTKKAKATSTAAKYFKTKKKFLNSAAAKNYKAFRKQVVYNKSYVMPGLKVTNVAGFNVTRMVPQSITFAGNYLLISAYDFTKTQESVIYIMDKVTRKYITTLVLPHTGHVGGLTYDGVNVWLTYGKNLQSIKYSVVQAAARSGKPYTEIYKFTSVCPVPETASYVAYYKGKIWAGAYNEKVKKYMYGYTINNKTGVPTLTRTNRMLMPNRTQGVAFTSGGKMIISRSCQTKKGRSGFMSQLDTYKPTWNLSKTSVKKNKRQKVVKMPPMNEGIAISGSYTYVIYESPAFNECQAPLDRITAFKTSKIS